VHQLVIKVLRKPSKTRGRTNFALRTATMPNPSKLMMTMMLKKVSPKLQYCECTNVYQI